MSTYKIGFDLDGIICPDTSRWQQWLCNLSPLFVELVQSTRKMKFKPPKDALIITSRPSSDKANTARWMLKHGIENTIVFTKDKAKAIREWGLDIYYESDRDIAIALQDACPKTQIILWKEV
ncbi:MAG: hypothetical protein ACWGQW_01035 [bacterium]